MNGERKNEGENKKEGLKEGLSDIQQELKSKLMARVKALSKPEDASGTATIQQIILSFANKDFDENEIKRIDEIHALLGNYGRLRIMEISKDRYEKWLRKRGKEFSETAQRKMLEAHEMMALVEYLNGLVCDTYGITGTMRGMYRAFALRVMRKAIENMPEAWLQRGNQVFKEWCIRKDLNKEILRTLVWLVLKGLHWYYRTAKKF